MLKKINIFNGYIFAWILGLGLPFLYFVFFANSKKIFSFSKNVYYVSFVIFFFIQLVALSLSIFNDYFDAVRWVASLHNIVVYLFFLQGFMIILTLNNVDHFLKHIHSFFILLLVLAFISTLYYYTFKSPLIISSAISTLKLIDDEGPGTFPRFWFLSPYPNAVAIMLFISFVLYSYYQFKKSEYLRPNFFIIIFFLAAILLTGSRITTVVSFGLVIVLYVDNSLKLKLASIIVSAVILIASIYNIPDLILAHRSGSNSMRTLIYITSLHAWLDTNIFFGLGLKPHVPDFIYPLGSHSTPIGYFVKTGLIGGLAYMYFMLFHILRIIFDLLKMHSHYYFDQKYLTLSYSVLGLFIIYVFEDMDAFEFNALLTGILFAFFVKRRKKWTRSHSLKGDL